MTRLPRVCLVDGCPNIAKARSNRCAEHPASRSPSSAATSTAEWKHTRALVLERDRGVCQVCGAPATQVDHIEPVSYGGGNAPENARAVCEQCNLDARPGYKRRRPAQVARQSGGGMSGLFAEEGLLR